MKFVAIHALPEENPIIIGIDENGYMWEGCEVTRPARTFEIEVEGYTPESAPQKHTWVQYNRYFEWRRRPMPDAHVVGVYEEDLKQFLLEERPIPVVGEVFKHYGKKVLSCAERGNNVG